MKNLVPLPIICAAAFALYACASPIERDAEKLAELACEGERTSDLDQKNEIRDEYRKLEKELTLKYKESYADTILLWELYFRKLNDCLGYVPVR